MCAPAKLFATGRRSERSQHANRLPCRCPAAACRQLLPTQFGGAVNGFGKSVNDYLNAAVAIADAKAAAFLAAALTIGAGTLQLKGLSPSGLVMQALTLLIL